MDRERADFDSAVVARQMDANPVVLSIPIGSGANFAGVIDVLAMQALRDGWPRGGSRRTPRRRAGAHAHLVEAVARMRRHATRSISRRATVGGRNARACSRA
jgi:elongation factor G